MIFGDNRNSAGTSGNERFCFDGSFNDFQITAVERHALSRGMNVTEVIVTDSTSGGLDTFHQTATRPSRPDMTGCIVGLHPGVTPAMLAYAAMQGVAFQFADCVAAQESIGARIERVTVVGGGTRSALWRSLLATVLDRALEQNEA